MSPRGVAVVTFVVLVAGLVAALVAMTPPDPLTSAPAAAAVEPDAALDFTAEQIAVGDALTSRLRPPSLLSLGVGLAVALLLGLTPLGARLVEAAARSLGGGWVWQVLLGGLAVLALVRLATLPFAVWGQAVRRDEGLATGSWGAWLADVGKGFAVNAVLTLLVVLLLVGLARALPTWWWVPAAAGAAVLVVVVSFLYPLVVEPLFNTFTPMADSPLRTSLMAMAEEDGVPVDDVLVADASRRTTTLNAYVSGFGSSRRIVVYDTLLEQAPDAEVRLVVAHELGHAARNDVLWGTLAGALGAATGVVGLALLMGWAPLLRRAGVDGIADGRAVALLLALIAAVSLLTAPVQSWASRRIEARADQHALDLTGDPATFVAMQHRLAVTAKADVTPNPFLAWWFGTHPTAPQRIAAARTWARLHGVTEPPPLVSGLP